MRGTAGAVQLRPASIFEQLVVEDETGEVVGVLVAYDQDRASASCRVTVLLADAEAMGHQALEALDPFVRQLFRDHPLRKIYAELPATTDRAAVVEELRDHWVVAGVEHDMTIVVTYRDLWSATAAHVIAAAHST